MSRMVTYGKLGPKGKFPPKVHVDQRSRFQRTHVGSTFPSSLVIGLMERKGGFENSTSEVSSLDKSPRRVGISHYLQVIFILLTSFVSSGSGVGTPFGYKFPVSSFSTTSFASSFFVLFFSNSSHPHNVFGTLLSRNSS